jgi:N-methylhydantoinase A
MAANGEVVTPLDREHLLAQVQELVDEGVESIAICFLNSYINPVHERAAQAAIQARFPNLLLSVSSEVLPEVKEYERTSTTTVNAYILPAMRAYLSQLKDQLRAMGIEGSLQVMASNGGMMGIASATARPVFAVASGPAGGVAGAAEMGRVSGDADLIVFDMGGTTAKASIVSGFEPSLTNEYEFREGITAPSRFVKGGGYVLKVPAIDIAEVGAGGGSIAWIDAGGLLCVGPQSAGAVPGPACYGKGNRHPTVTDANIVLGYLNPRALAGGSLPVHPALAADAVRSEVGERLKLDLKQAAHGIRRVANVSMARAIRAVTVERGKDPRDMSMMAFGGGGPLHAVDVAKLLGVRRVIAPVMAGVFCSAGMLAADAEHNFVKAVLRPMKECDPAALNAALAALLDKGHNVLASEGFAPPQCQSVSAADVRFVGQSSELTVAIRGGRITSEALDAIDADFRALYKQTFGYTSNESLELVNLRVAARGRSAHRLNFSDGRIDAAALEGEAEVRSVSFAADAPDVQTPIVARSSIEPLARPGPLIIESYDTTIVVPPGCTAHADSIGNVIIDIAGRGA